MNVYMHIALVGGFALCIGALLWHIIRGAHGGNP